MFKECGLACFSWFSFIKGESETLDSVGYLLGRELRFQRIYN